MSNTEWQSIDTAPKDDTYVLVYDLLFGVMVASNNDFTGWSAKWDDRCTEINPTHWKPLPQPPQN